MLDFEGNLFYLPVFYLKALPKEHRGEQTQLCEWKPDWDPPVPGFVHTGDIKSSTGEWCRGGLLRLWFCCICLKRQTSKTTSSKISFLYLPAKTWAQGSMVSLVRVDYAIKLHHQLSQEKHWAMNLGPSRHKAFNFTLGKNKIFLIAQFFKAWLWMGSMGLGSGIFLMHYRMEEKQGINTCDTF